MKMADIKVEDVLAGKNWLLEEGERIEETSNLRETIGFTGTDIGLLAALVRFKDGSEHAALVVKSFPAGGDDIDVYIWSRFGWMTLQAPGFMRAVGKYSHDIFPFDYFLATPWKGGKRPEPDKASSHPKQFQSGVQRIKAKR